MFNHILSKEQLYEGYVLLVTTISIISARALKLSFMKLFFSFGCSLLVQFYKTNKQLFSDCIKKQMLITKKSCD